MIDYITNRSRLNEALREAGYNIDGERFPEGYQEAPLAYDAVWAVALGNRHEYKISKTNETMQTPNHILFFSFQ